jgi:cellulose synthase/poly-beta-1,6-N-acetylglucosamine synthase-like glycosyltransferase
MQDIVSWLLAILAVVVAIPTALLCLEILAGMLSPPACAGPTGGTRRRIAVVVPARNESATISLTLRDIQPQLSPGDRLLVVADNCKDDTADIARQVGAEVIERHNPTRIGKGYALDFGIRHLEGSPPDVVVVIDADCGVAQGAIGRLVSVCASTGRPVQALYLMTMPSGSQINHQVAEFAWRVKNWARPLGLAGFRLPCQLMGTGMTFPWEVIRTADLAHDWSVEDLKLGLELAEAGHAPIFCPTALVTSCFAATARGADIQRRRWEHGHIATILKKAPRLLGRAIAQGNLNLLGLTLDLLVPPLSLLAIMLMLSFLLDGAAALSGLRSTAFMINAGCIAGFAISVGIAWKRYGRDVLPSRSTLLIPGYIIRKFGIYGQACSGHMSAQWARSADPANCTRTAPEIPERKSQSVGGA